MGFKLFGLGAETSRAEALGEVRELQLWGSSEVGALAPIERLVYIYI